MVPLVQWIESLVVFSPYLPLFARAVVWLGIAIIGLIPLSILSWLLLKALSQPLTAVISSLKAFSDAVLGNSRKTFARASRVWIALTNSISIVSKFDAPTYSFDAHPLQAAIDDLEHSIKNSPALIADAESEKTKIIEVLNGHLQNLSSSITRLKDIKIPHLELDKNVEIVKRNALSSLWIFSPLLISVIIINTVLLNVFFSEILEDMEVFSGLSYGLLVAAMFSAVEAGAGVVIGFIDTHKDSEEEDSFAVIKGFCWLIVLCLMILEWYLYLKLGANFQEDFELENYNLLQDWGVIWAQGMGWLSMLGIVIVAGLYAFGHMASRSYFKYIQAADLQRLKNDLDKHSSSFEQLNVLTDEISEKVVKVVVDLRAENTKLGNVGELSSEVIEALSLMIDEKRDSIANSISEIATLEPSTPEIEVAHFGPGETASFLKFNFIYLVLLCVSVGVYYIGLPNIIQLGETVISSPYEKLLLTILVITLSVLSGFLIMSSVRVFSITDGRVARLILERRHPITYLFFSVLVLATLSVTYMLTSQYQSAGGTPSFIISTAALVGAFFVGKVILHAFPIWFGALHYLWIFLRALILLGISWGIKIGQALAELILRILQGFSAPVGWFIGVKVKV